MKKNYLMWLLGGAALYFLTRKKETVTVSETTTTADLGNGSSSTEIVPKVKEVDGKTPDLVAYNKGIAY
jgi:hypothetical protein